MLLSRLIVILLLILSACSTPKKCCSQIFKFSTFYAAVNGNTSLANENVYSVYDGVLGYDTITTPYDYSLTLGIRKIKRFQYEDVSKFKDGTESAYGDAATVGLAPFEYLFEVDYKRQEGVSYIDQNHFIRYVNKHYVLKAEYLKDGFADVEYFETSQRYKKDFGKLSFNIGAVQRMSEPYGYDPLDDWSLENDYIHYTYLAIQEGYEVDVWNSEYKDPNGNIVATSNEVWEEVVIPVVLKDYVERKKNELDRKLLQSLVIGFDYYYYKKNIWLHTWGNVMPYHYDDGGEYSYHEYNDNEQWYDLSGGLIFGYKLNKHLGLFTEGRYNKYWNRMWYDFKCGINYVIF